MRFFFLRHGSAEDAAPGTPDAARRLTPEGVEEMRAVGAGLRRLGIDPDCILTSPALRARETAELAGEALGLAERIEEERRLAPGRGADELLAALDDRRDAGSVLLVGHEPTFSEAISALIGGGCVRVGKASLVRVDAPRAAAGAGELRWALPAKLLVLLGQECRAVDS